MPFGILEIGLQILLAIHAARTGRLQPWLYIILFLPGLGCLLYGIIVLLPELASGRTVRTLLPQAVDIVAPTRGYRTLAKEVEIAPTVFNKSHLAEECLRLGRNTEAVDLYRSCLTGLHVDDPATRLNLARALFAEGDAKGAVHELDTLGREHPSSRTSAGHLLYARALDAAGWTDLALSEYAALVGYFSGEEARFRYGELLVRTGAVDRGADQFRKILRRVDLGSKPYRRSQREWYDAARRALAQQAQAVPSPAP